MSERTAYVIDFDSTLVTAESLDNFAEFVLKDAPDRESICAELRTITERGMAGELPFGASLAARLALFKAHRDHIPLFNEELAAQLSPSAVEHADWFKANAEDIYVVSGGFEEFIRPTVRELGILEANIHANRFTFDGDGTITGYDTDRYTGRAGGKAAQVAALKLDGSVIAIGDGYTDLQIRLDGAADEFWAYTETVSRPAAIAGADRVIASFAGLAYVKS